MVAGWGTGQPLGIKLCGGRGPPPPPINRQTLGILKVFVFWWLG